MQKVLFAMLLAMAWCLPGPAVGEDPSSIAGAWRGPWYRGMTSGLMTLEIAADATGRVAFTNLETFGDLPVPLAKARVQDNGFQFSAVGASGRDFAAELKPTTDGKVLRGTARYEGFQVKFDLLRSD